MKIKGIELERYEFGLISGQKRFAILVSMTDEKGNVGRGEIAPLPQWSAETQDECLEQLERKQQEIATIEWTAQNWAAELAQLKLLPAVSFGVESALLSLLDPLPPFSIPVSALFMGPPEEILEQAKLRYEEGYTSAKLKVGHLDFKQAEQLIDALKNLFRLRIDVNRAWSTADSLRFFSKYPLDAFDYVEEPFQNPCGLAQFPHPLAVDESFPQDLSLKQLDELPTLKALIYKPTIQGGLLGCFPLQEWLVNRKISLVLSSSFESPLGLAHIASMAHRLSLSAPIGIGTYHYLTDPIKFSFAPCPFLEEMVNCPCSKSTDQNGKLLSF